MDNPDAIILCTDANMMVPALFVAHAARAHAGARAAGFDTLIVTDLESAGPRERAFMAANGIRHEAISFDDLRSVFDKSDRLTAATLVKLTLAERFAGRYRRILYLDCDLTLHADVSTLFGLDLAGMPVAANRRGVLFRTEAERRTGWEHFAELGMTEPYCYFNSGVMLIDVDAWKAERLAERCLDFIRRNPALCPLPDEDSLNAILDGRFAPLSPLWNMPPRRDIYMPLHAQLKAAAVHYSGHDKPWKRFGAFKPLFPDMEAYRLYETFLASSPWPHWLAAQWNRKDLAEALRTAWDRQWRIWRGASDEPTRQQAADYAARFFDYVATAEFCDVTQGLTRREGSRLSIDTKDG
jgi:lipopolysaccharide biosynthesis glycosyltransferase